MSESKKNEKNVVVLEKADMNYPPTKPLTMKPLPSEPTKKPSNPEKKDK